MSSGSGPLPGSPPTASAERPPSPAQLLQAARQQPSPAVSFRDLRVLNPYSGSQKVGTSFFSCQLR